MIKRRTKQIMAVAGLTAVAGTAVPIGVVFGLQQAAKSSQASVNSPVLPVTTPSEQPTQFEGNPTDSQGGQLTPDGNSMPPAGVSTAPVTSPSGSETSAPGANSTSTSDPANPALTKPVDEISASITGVDNTDPYYVSDNSLPTLMVAEPTPKPGYALTGGYVWKDSNGAILDGAAFVALPDGAAFSAVWTIEPTNGAAGLPYTYTQRFKVAKLVYDIPANQTSPGTTSVDNASRSTLPTDLLAPPTPADGYVVSGSVAWHDASGAVLTDPGFAALADNTAFSAVWTFKRADLRTGTYTYTQRFVVALPKITNPGDQQSPLSISVNNISRSTLPTDLLVQPAPADGYAVVGSATWLKADGSALTDDGFVGLADKDTFTAVWTLERSDGTPNDTYRYFQRFAIAQPPLIPVADKVSESVTDVDNFGASAFPTTLLAPPPIADEYRADGTYQWLDSAGNALSLQSYTSLKEGASFSAVWHYKRIDERTGSYKYTQRFVVKLTEYANENSATPIEVDNLANTALPNDLRVAPTPKPGYVIFGSPVWQIRNAVLNGNTYAKLQTGTDFGAVWTLRRADGQAGSYTYTQTFVTKNAGPATIVYPYAYPVLTNTTLLFYGKTHSLPTVLGPQQQSDYKPWSAPVFVNEANGEVVTDATFPSLPAGTRLLATITAGPAEGKKGAAALYQIRFVIQKGTVTVNSADLSSYGYGLFSANNPFKVFSVSPTALKPARVAGYKDWDDNPVLQVKVNPIIAAQYPTGWMTIGDGTNNTIRPADFAASVTAQISKPYGIEYADAASMAPIYTYEYRYVWHANLEENYDGDSSISFIQNFYLADRLRMRSITSTPVYDFTNTGFASDAKFQLAFDGTPVSVTVANLAEAVNYKYPDTVDTASAASPTALSILMPEATKALNGEMVPTTYGDYYTSMKTGKVVNNNYFVKSQASSMTIANVSYADGMSDAFDLASFIGRHIAFSSRPLISVAYQSDSPDSLVALANSLKFTDTWFYAGFYYFPEDYQNEQLSMDEIQKMLYNWQPSYRDIPWSSMPDYQMIERVGHMHSPVLTGYDANGNGVYTALENKGDPAIAGQSFFGSRAGKVDLAHLQTGYFTRLYSSKNLYSYDRDPGVETKFNLGSFAYVQNNTLHAFLFAYFDNLPLSNRPAKIGFTYMINGTTLAI